MSQSVSHELLWPEPIASPPFHKKDSTRHVVALKFTLAWCPSWQSCCEKQQMP